MSRLFIGIDFSLNSIGVVFRENKETKYLNILNRYAISANNTKQNKLSTGEVFAQNEVVNSITGLDNVIIKPVVRKPIPIVKKIGLIEWERLHITSCLSLGKTIYEAIKEVIYQHYRTINTQDIYVCLENYSYGSSTDNLIQVVEATMRLKQLIFEDLMLCVDHFSIITGPTLKMWAGKGDYDKYQMLMAYIQNHRGDKSLEDDSFWKFIKKNKGLYLNERMKKGKPFIEVKTPISDIIDAYFCCLWLEDKIGLTGL